ncbi:patatin-like phospholipase family protein [Mitsuaria sp. GD03876]|uniref:patatin-like phospholipase family protein n=1 Tax=Mitsuaria sp. GD03876 TaxID=2975399 RepID=UPI002446F04C|nr:patatin-like phospholipase family protein [Mitsuaria sp. GD03876]MDH0863928.1 patatin-like phospholipase family protein [Mitsuaria sp. GD03876]
MRWSDVSGRLGVLATTGIAVALLAGCSTYRPWINEGLPVAKDGSPPVAASTRRPGRPIVAAVTLSGGGARAAAFGLGVLQELKATGFVLDGQPTTLLDQVTLVSGVSGGSILAAHYAAFGDETLTRFEPDFLLVPFEAGLIRQAFAPRRLYHLTSPWYGRTHILAQRLDELYRGRTFGDLRSRPGAPDLMVTATDLTTGAPFDFTPEQFGLICSDLDRTPLSFAVAASSAVPILLSPMTLRNHAGECAPAPRAAHESGGDYRTRMLALSAESYRDAKERPYIHLVDGGVSDNTGARLMLDRFLAGGSMASSFPDVAPGSIHRMVLVTVNSERDLAERIDAADRIPSTGQVVETLVFGAGARETQITLAMLNDDNRRWQEELKRTRGTPGSPFAADAELHIVSVSLHDVPDDKIRYSMLRVPTAFTIEAGDVRELQKAGAQALRAAPAFKRLKESLERLSPADTPVLSPPSGQSRVESVRAGAR